MERHYGSLPTSSFRRISPASFPNGFSLKYSGLRFYETSKDVRFYENVEGSQKLVRTDKNTPYLIDGNDERTQNIFTWTGWKKTLLNKKVDHDFMRECVQRSPSCVRNSIILSVIEHVADNNCNSTLDRGYLRFFKVF